MAESDYTYPYNTITTVTPHATDENIKGARYIQVVTGGNVVFTKRDGTLTGAIPIAANQSFALGFDLVGINDDAGTTASGFRVYWPAGNDGVALS